MRNNDKRAALQKELDDAIKLLNKFERTKLPQVQQELTQVAALEAQIDAVLRAQKADPSKNYDEQLQILRQAKDERKAHCDSSMEQYRSILREIERLKTAIGNVNKPSSSRYFASLFGG